MFFKSCAPFQLLIVDTEPHSQLVENVDTMNNICVQN